MQRERASKSPKPAKTPKFKLINLNKISIIGLLVVMLATTLVTLDPFAEILAAVEPGYGIKYKDEI